jgi:hypothetical protein
MTEFIVRKTVEYIYTVDALTAEEASKAVENHGTIEADQWSSVSIEVESINDYEESLNGND